MIKSGIPVSLLVTLFSMQLEYFFDDILLFLLILVICLLIFNLINVIKFVFPGVRTL